MLQKLDTHALQLESRFSLPPNALGYCGRGTAKDAFTKCLVEGDCSTVAEEITHFIVLYPYLKTLSQVTGLPYTDYRVIESYWIGNDLMDQFKPEHYDLLIKNLADQGVPPWLIDEIKANRPRKAFVPIHLFNILHVGVGRASGSVEFNLESVNHCMVRWGEVTEVNRCNDVTMQRCNVTLFSLSSHTPPYQLVTSEQSFACNPLITPNLKVGSTVAVHWKQVVKELTSIELENLKHWTQKLLDSLN